jgi:hypothetical protein
MGRTLAGIAGLSRPEEVLALARNRQFTAPVLFGTIPIPGPLFLPPLALQALQLIQHPADVLHAFGDAVSDRRWNGRFVVPVHEASLLQQAQPLGQYPRRDALNLTPQHPEPRPWSLDSRRTSEE